MCVFLQCLIVAAYVVKMFLTYIVFLSQERLVSILFGMLRQHKFNFVDVYREEAFTALKATVKQVSWLLKVVCSYGIVEHATESAYKYFRHIHTLFHFSDLTVFYMEHQ